MVGSTPSEGISYPMNTANPLGPRIYLSTLSAEAKERELEWLSRYKKMMERKKAKPLPLDQSTPTTLSSQLVGIGGEVPLAQLPENQRLSNASTINVQPRLTYCAPSVLYADSNPVSVPDTGDRSVPSAGSKDRRHERRGFRRPLAGCDKIIRTPALADYSSDPLASTPLMSDPFSRFRFGHMFSGSSSVSRVVGELEPDAHMSDPFPIVDDESRMGSESQHDCSNTSHARLDFEGRAVGSKAVVHDHRAASQANGWSHSRSWTAPDYKADMSWTAAEQKGQVDRSTTSASHFTQGASSEEVAQVVQLPRTAWTCVPGFQSSGTGLWADKFAPRLPGPVEVKQKKGPVGERHDDTFRNAKPCWGVPAPLIDSFRSRPIATLSHESQDFIAPSTSVGSLRSGSIFFSRKRAPSPGNITALRPAKRLRLTVAELQNLNPLRSPIRQLTLLYIGNLALTTQEDDLVELLEPFIINEMIIPTLPGTDRPGGYALVDLPASLNIDEVATTISGRSCKGRDIVAHRALLSQLTGSYAPPAGDSIPEYYRTDDVACQSSQLSPSKSYVFEDDPMDISIHRTRNLSPETAGPNFTSLTTLGMRNEAAHRSEALEVVNGQPTLPVEGRRHHLNIDAIPVKTGEGASSRTARLGVHSQRLVAPFQVVESSTTTPEISQGPINEQQALRVSLELQLANTTMSDFIDFSGCNTVQALFSKMEQQLMYQLKGLSINHVFVRFKPEVYDRTIRIIKDDCVAFSALIRLISAVNPMEDIILVAVVYPTESAVTVNQSITAGLLGPAYNPSFSVSPHPGLRGRFLANATLTSVKPSHALTKKSRGQLKRERQAMEKAGNGHRATGHASQITKKLERPKVHPPRNWQEFRRHYQGILDGRAFDKICIDTVLVDSVGLDCEGRRCKGWK